MPNLFDDLETRPEAEVFTRLLRHDGVRILRIASHGQASPPDAWYDQADHEWVVVLRGEGVVAFPDGREVRLGPGDYLHLPAHTRHRVARTAADEPTVWLAVHYGGPDDGSPDGDPA